MYEKDWETQYHKLDKRVGIVEVKVDSMEKKLDKISDNTTWILRIIIGGIIGGVLFYFFNL